MEIPRHWRLRKQRYSLVGEVCPHCQAKLFPPRDVCPNAVRRLKTLPVQRRGEVYSYTTVYDPRLALKRRPLHRGAGQARRGPPGDGPAYRPGRSEGRDCTPVEMVTRKLRNDGDERGMIVYGYKFRPAGLH